MCGLALLTLKKDDLRGREWLFYGLIAIIILVGIYLVPLPSGIWSGLPGREAIAHIDAIAGLGSVWRPLSITPMNGWHSFAALATPLATLLLGVQLNRNELYRLLPVLIVLGAISGLFGLFQIIGNPSGPLYLYRITNNGSAVGLFANRNHAAILLSLIFPMLAVYINKNKLSKDRNNSIKIIAISIALFLVPLILITGSRLGVILSGIGILGFFILYPRRDNNDGADSSKNNKKFSYNTGLIISAIALFFFGIVTIFHSRAEAINRIFQDGSDETGRMEFWTISSQLIGKYFPWGSGSGSFVEAYQIIEPDHVLGPTYLNHAHNDWLETAITFGLPGILLLMAALFFFVLKSAKLWFGRDGKHLSVVMARLSSILIAMLAIASGGDYPLRTPIMMSVFIILCLWLAEGARPHNGRHTVNQQRP